MLAEVREDIPCFIQAHSMGCLGTMTFLINNPNLKIAALVAGSPFWGMGTKVNRVQRIIVWALATFMEEMPINNAGSSHFLSHDKYYYIHEILNNPKRQNSYLSGGVINSMMESCDDIMTNAKSFTKPMLVFIAGKDRIIRNDCTRNFLSVVGTDKTNIKMRVYPNSYHNIHKEPEYKYRQLAEIYEFLFTRLEMKPTNFSLEDLKKVKFGRPDKKKSIKVKRSIFEIFLITYLFYGVIILLLRHLVRRMNQQTLLSAKKALYTVAAWPVHLINLMVKMSKIYY